MNQSALVIATILLALFTQTAIASDDSTDCSISVINSYDESDVKNDFAYVLIYDGDDDSMLTARYTKNLDYNSTWNTSCDDGGNNRCRMKWHNRSTAITEWLYSATDISCGGSYSITEETSSSAL